MTFWIWFFVALYFVGFMCVFVLNLNIGPVTPGLAFVRAVVWPLWLATGWPSGTVQPFD